MTKTPTSRTSLKKQSEQPSLAERISSAVEYYRLGLAAKNLECDIEELLHLGVIGKAQIMAPVFMSGWYDWLSGEEDIIFPELDGPFRRHFGMSDRVILLPEDLAQIEAIGWAKPTRFCAPSVARKLVEYERTFVDEGSYPVSDEIEQKQLRKLLADQLRAQQDNSSITTISTITSRKTDDGKYVQLDKTEKVLSAEDIQELLPAAVRTDDSYLMQQVAYFSPWQAIQPEDAQIKTEINHLFISRNEIERIKAGKPVDEASRAQSDGLDRRGESHAIKREEVLLAALYCKSKWPQDCERASTWTTKIEQEWAGFRPGSAEPPLATDTITRLLNLALKFGEKKRQDLPK